MSALPHRQAGWYPAAFPGIDRREAVWNAVLSHAGTAIPLAGGATAAFEPGHPPGDAALCSRLLLRDGPFDPALSLYVAWRRFPFRAMFRAEIDVDDLPVLPLALRDALVQGMTDVMADVMAGAIGKSRLSVTATERFGDTFGGLPDDVSWFEVGVEGLAGDGAAATVGVSRAALLACAPAQALLPARVYAQARALIALPGTFTLGSTTLTAHDLTQLIAGSVILLPHMPPNRRMLRVDKTILEFHAAADGWILAGQRRRAPRPGRRPFRERDVTDQTRMHDAGGPVDDEAAETAIPQPEAVPNAGVSGADLPGAEFPGDVPAAAGAPPEADGHAESPPGEAGPAELLPGDIQPEEFRIADLGITVDFDIGERDFTLAEIETWQPGAVVALEPPALAGRVEVTLGVNGRAIAVGDLVAIDDRLAVRLSRLLLRP